MKSDVIIAVITLIGTITTAWLQYRSKIKLEKYHKEVNGRMDELIDTTKKIATLKERKRTTKK